MRNRLVTFLILLMIALPVWSASVPCCHFTMQRVVGAQQSGEHACCHHMGADECSHASTGSIDDTFQADQCQCDQFQHSQFVLILPQLPVLQSAAQPAPELPVPALLAERHETIIRPPIA